ncbi:beta strand repeat-containing protein [Kushneria aurantia]|nr:hypothetical protein [Kushneria aurantia]
MATINFNTSYYLQDKLEQLQNGEDAAQYSDWTTQDVEEAFSAANLTPEQHYEQFGSVEGLNPSPQFDTDAYLQEKLAQLQDQDATQANGEPYETAADVLNAFRDAGLSPLEHYNEYGQEEGLTAPAVPGSGGDDGGEGPDVPTPEYTVNFDSSEKSGSTVTVGEDGNLVLTDVSQGDTVSHIGKAQYDETGQYPTSSDFRFTLSNQLNYGNTEGGDTFQGTFLSPLLTPTGGIGDGSILDLRFADRLAPADDPSQTLSNTQVNYFEFTYNGTEYQVNDDNTNGLLGQARDYDALLEAIETGIENLQEANPELSGLSVTRGSTFSVNQYDRETDNLTGDDVQGISIVLSARQGDLGGFSANVTSVDEGGVDSYARAFDQTTTGVEGLIQTTLDLSNIGYGSQGGSVNIAGESNSNVGVEKFNVTTESGVWLTELSSTDTANNSGFDHLKVVEVSGSGYFRVGQQSQSWGHSNNLGEYFTQNAQTADWVSPLVADTTGGAQGLTNVQDLDLTGITGSSASSAINAAIDNRVIDRDLNLTDVNGNPAQDNVVYNYDLTGGDDVLNMGVDGSVLAQSDFELEISTGAGADVVHLSNGITTSAQLVNQQLNDNITIDTGAGNDRVWSEGAGNATITTGSGDDLVLADNSGDQAGVGTNSGRAQFVFNNATQNINDLESNSDVDLSNGANGTAQSFTISGLTGAATMAVRVNFQGFEAVTNINIASGSVNGDGEASITALQINQAIKSAINGNDVLKELLQAQDGNGNSLIVNSRIDGGMELSDLNISFSGQNSDGEGTISFPDLLSNNGTEDDNSDGVYETQFGQDTVGGTDTDVTGADSTVESDNTINVGTGTDEIVLGTGANSNDTVAFTDYNNGFNTIVNFTDGEVVGNGADANDGDILDFTSYLGGSSSGLTTTAGALNDDQIALVNNFTSTGSGDNAISFADLNASNLLQALNSDSGTFSGFSAVSGDAGSNATNYILLVESGGTAGEHKAFHLTSNAESTDFASAQLIGTIDFGVDQNFDATNFA